MSIEEMNMLVFSIIDPEGAYTIIEQNSIRAKSSFAKLQKKMIRKIDSIMD